MTIEVTQEDRNREADLEQVMDGHWTEDMRKFVAERFAHHRQAAYEKGLKDGASK